MIELIAINSLFIFGVYASFQEGMIFESFGNRLESWRTGTPLQRFIRKPLGACPTCMASAYGFPIFWGYYFLSGSSFFIAIITYICYSFALAGLNMIVMAIISE